MRRTRTHYTREEKARLLAEYHGGQTGTAQFAADHGIRLATLRTWLSRRPAATKSNGGRPAVKFVAVDTSMGHRGDVEIRVGEVMIQLSSSVGAGFVADLVSRLASPQC